MLKIKDNVDLKELEKFGFHLKSDEEECEELKNTKLDGYIYGDIWTEHLTISLTRREINGYLKDKLFDLIKADLVEKVEER